MSDKMIINGVEKKGYTRDDRIAQMKFAQRKPHGNLADPRLRYDYLNREIGTLPPDTEREPFRWVSELAYKNIHRIVTRGWCTTELAEAGYGIVDYLFINWQARIPLEEERDVLDYCMVLGLEDGLSNPALIARLITRGKSYLTQACGGSVLAFGHSFASYDSTGKMILKYVGKVEEGMSLDEAAKLCVQECKKEAHFGISKLYAKDPTPKKLLDYAEKKLASIKKLRYVPFMKALEKAAKAEDSALCVDMIGALSATMLELEFTADGAWVLMGVTRAFAAGAHGLEEMEREGNDVLGQVLTPKEWYDGPADRPVPSLAERKGLAGAQSQEPKEWQANWKKRQELKGTGYSVDFVIEDPKKAAMKQHKKK
ncbi:MAG: hypothetical protein FWC36_02825 [Spirochaetes bacterium]|nr:hypothetical protein [Spirochaetota bacterium]